jgi:hypothetical protein
MGFNRMQVYLLVESMGSRGRRMSHLETLSPRRTAKMVAE